MEDNPILQIKDAVIKALKSIDPETDIFFEEISRTDPGHGLNQGQTWYFVDLMPGAPVTVDGIYTDMGVSVDIAYHEKSERSLHYLTKSAEIDRVFRPVLSFGDRRITIDSADIRVVDHVLHYGFRVNFRHSTEPDIRSARMDELGVSFQKESEAV